MLVFVPMLISRVHATPSTNECCLNIMHGKLRTRGEEEMAGSGGTFTTEFTRGVIPGRLEERLNGRWTEVSGVLGAASSFRRW